MKKKVLILFLSVFAFNSIFGQIFISEVADPKDNSNARFIELYNPTSANIDLTAGQYYICRQANGGGMNSKALTGTIPANSTYVIATNLDNYLDAYGSNADFAFGSLSGNGDDGYFLYIGGNHETGTLYDAYGVVNQDGTDKEWEYTDSRVVRNSNVVAPNATWTASEWTITNNSNVADMEPGNHSVVAQTAPIISGIAISPEAPSSTDEVTVTAIITDDIAVTSAKLYWATSAGVTADNGTEIVMTANGNIYTAATIPAQVDGTTVYYIISATDGTETTTSTEASYTVADPVLAVINLPYSRDFETGDLNTDGWTTKVVTGTRDWKYASYQGDHFAKMSNYSGGSNSESETWFISPKVDLTSASNPIFNFMNSCKFPGSDIEVLVSSDYDGTSMPSTATWTTLSATLSGGSFNDVFSGDIDLSAYAGGFAYLAFKYTGTATNGKTWQIDDINIKENVVISNITISPDMPTSSEEVTVTATIRDDISVTSAKLYWATSAGVTAGNGTEIVMTVNGNVCTTNIPAQVDGTTVYYIVSVAYDTETATSAEASYTVADPVLAVINLPYSRDFETGDLNTDGWTTKVVTGTRDWTYASYQGDHFAKMSNYSGGNNSESETWFISPKVDLTSASNPIFNFMNSCKYAGSDIEVLVSSDYDGTSMPSTATWTTLSATLSGGSFNDVFSGDIDLSAYAGGFAYLAFKYTGTATNGKTWQIDDINIKENVVTLPTKLVITSADGVYVNTEFEITVNSVDDNGTEVNVTEDTEVEISLVTGTGTLGGTLTGTIVNGENSVTLGGLTYDVTETIEIKASVATGMTLTTSENKTITVSDAPIVPNVFISEYIEGEGNNKAIEIYNGTDTEFDMSSLSLKQSYNGNGWGMRDDVIDTRYTLPLSGILAEGEVYVITASDASDATIISQSDLALSYESNANGSNGSNVVFFGGNDAIGLFYNDMLIDVIGVETEAPTPAWNVGASTAATQNNTLVRKYPEVTIGTTDWAASAGTNNDNSQWEVKGLGNYSTLGWHGEQTIDLEIVNAYSSADAIYVTYNEAPESVDANNYKLKQGTIVTFSNAELNEKTLKLTGASSQFNSDLELDTIVDMANSTEVLFYAGVLPVSYTNSANAPDTIISDYNATFDVVVTADDEYNQVWVQDEAAAKHGLLVFDENLGDEINTGDKFLLVGKKKIFNDLTELVSPMIISEISSDNSVTAVSVDGAELSYSLEANNSLAEPWEGQFVKINTIMIDSLNSNYYEYFGRDDNNNIICINDDVDYHYQSGLSLDVGSKYSVSGVVTYGYGHYKINPRNSYDVQLIIGVEDIENTVSIYPNPASDFLIFKGEINSARLFNVLGSQMNVNLSNNRMNISKLASGIYVVQVILSDGRVVNKQIVKQ